MSLFKNLILTAGAFAAGYAVGASDDSKLKEQIDKLFEKAKISAHDLRALVLTAIHNIEGLDVDELKLNLSKGFEHFKDKVSEFMSMEEPKKIQNNSKKSTTKKKTSKKSAKTTKGKK